MSRITRLFGTDRNFSENGTIVRGEAVGWGLLRRGVPLEVFFPEAKAIIPLPVFGEGLGERSALQQSIRPDVGKNPPRVQEFS